MQDPFLREQDSFAQKETEATAFGTHPFSSFETEDSSLPNTRPPVPFNLADGNSSPPEDAPSDRNTLRPVGNQPHNSSSNMPALPFALAGMFPGQQAGPPLQAKGQGKQAPIQRQGDEKDILLPFTIHFEGAMSGSEFQRHAMQQLFGREIEGIEWTLTQKEYSQPVTLWVESSLIKTHQKQVYKHQGYETNADGELKGAEQRRKEFEKDKEEQVSKDISEEIERRYQKVMEANKGKGKQAPSDNKELKAKIQDEVLYQHAYLRNLPAEVSRFFRSQAKQMELGPQQFEQMFRIGKFIEQMSPDVQMDYLKKVSSETRNLDEFEQALRNHKYFSEVRQGITQKRIVNQMELVGMESVYQKYRSYRKLIRANISPHPLGAYTLNSNAYKLKQEINEELKYSHLEDFDAFDKQVREFENNFLMESQSIALNYLELHGGAMFREQEQLKDKETINQLFQAIQRGNGKDELGKQFRMFRDEKLPEDQQIDLADLKNAKSASELRSKLDDILRERGTNCLKAQMHIAEKPERIYQMENLMPYFYGLQGIQADSIFDMALQDKALETRIDGLIKSVEEIYLTFSLAYFSGGTSIPTSLATLAGAASFGLSAYMAHEEYLNYTKQNDLADNGLAEDPSVAWLVVSVVGAGLDLAVVSKSIRALAPVAKSLDETGDLADFNMVVKALEETNKISAKIARAVEKSAIAQQKLNQAKKALATRLLRNRATLYMNPFPDPYVFMHSVEIGIHLIQKGAAEFSQFQEALKAKNIIKKLNKSPEQKKFIEDAWKSAHELKGFSKAESILQDSTFDTIMFHLEKRIAFEPDQFRMPKNPKDLKRVVEHGHKNGLSLKEIEDMLFINCRSGKSIPPRELMIQMNNVLKIRKNGYPQLFKGKEDFANFSTQMESWTNDLMIDGKKLQWEELRIQGSSLRKMADPKNVKNGPGDIDLAIMVTPEEFDKVIRIKYNGNLMKELNMVTLTGKDAPNLDKLWQYFSKKKESELSVYEKTFVNDYRKKVIHGGSAHRYFKGLPKMIEKIQKQFPHLKAKAITLQVEKGRFDMAPDWIFKKK